jgi:hypothetical protein
VWVLAYWPDVVSDFSRFHRVRRIEDDPDLDAPGFFALAYRIEVYGGAVALRAAQHRAHQAPAAQAREMSFDEWVRSHQPLVIEAAGRTGGDRDAGS